MRSGGELLTTAEVAERFRVSTMTVRRWVAAGELEVIRLPGRTVRYRREDVERLGEPVTVDPSEAVS